MNPINFADDIPEALARAAHSGTSFVPEKRAQQERADYAAKLQHDYDHFRAQAEQGGTLALLEPEFERYRAGLLKHTTAYLQSRSQCLSWMITGPANFPTARNEKHNNASNKRVDELIAFRARARRAILSKLRPDLAPIRASDADAVDRLEVELAQLEYAQERMKAANVAIRKHKKQGEKAIVEALLALNFTAEKIPELLSPAFGRPGFPSYALSNNNANIARVRARIEQISAAQAKPVTEIQGTNARLEDNPPANRVRLFFPGKPEESVRTQLKRCGFRWTPTLGCWQAYRNHNSLRVAAEIGGLNEKEKAA